MTSHYPVEPSIAAKIVDDIPTASSAVSDVIETGRQPGRPLDIVAKAVREASLTALRIAYAPAVREASSMI